MGATQAQRVQLYTNLVELMGQQDADILIEQLPPSGWDNVATKQDLQATNAAWQAAIKETNATMAAGFAETNAAWRAAIKETNATMAAGFAEINAKFIETNAKFIETNATITETNATITGRMAKHLYITISSIALACVSLWIALLVGLPT